MDLTPLMEMKVKKGGKEAQRFNVVSTIRLHNTKSSTRPGVRPIDTFSSSTSTQKRTTDTNSDKETDRHKRRERERGRE